MRGQFMPSAVKLKQQITSQIQASLRQGRFEVKKGNTLASLAMVMNANHRTQYGYSKDILQDAQSFDKMFVDTAGFSKTGVKRNQS